MIGRTLGHYRVTAAIGAGGMGQVYRATDTKLGRDVAIKVLPEAFADDEERRARFEREAKLLASLNHPNIASIYGLEESGGVKALVLELVEGPTLAERIERGPVPVEEAIGIAKQIAQALEAGHEAGIVHRDLKPANVKLKEDGTVKVLDYGLAKALEGDAPRTHDSDLSRSPTLTRQGTEIGVILGTAAYMSPEQAKGKRVDKRTDVWAFGAVVYEMLTGKRAFAGDVASETLAAVLHAEPDYGRLPANTPDAVRKVLQLCLTKDAKLRLRDIADARLAIDGRFQTLPAPPPSKRNRWPWAVAALGFLAGVGGLLRGRGVEVGEPGTPKRFAIELPRPASVQIGVQQMPCIALSPDGRRIAFVAGGLEDRMLYLRDLNAFEAQTVSGSEGAMSPFFSPDGSWVGFVTNYELKKVAVGGGRPVALSSVSPVSRGASWDNDDRIVLTPAYSTGLVKVPAGGGELETLTTLDWKKNEANHMWPQALPNGDVVFTIWSGGSFDEATIALLSRRTGEVRTLVKGGSHGRVTRSGHLVFARAGSLLAVPFDREHGRVSGSPVPVLDGVMTSGATGSAQFSVSDDGTLAYLPSGPAHSVHLTWVDLRGNKEPLAMEARDLFAPRISPDGAKVLLGVLTDLWVHDLQTESMQRLTFRAVNTIATWSADGHEVFFTSTRLDGPLENPFAGTARLYRMRSDGGEEPRLLTGRSMVEFAGSSSPKGSFLYVTISGPGGSWDIWVLETDKPASARPFIASPFNETCPTFSPDGRWVAYVSDETGGKAVYVRSFPDSGAKWPVSSGGGVEPVWSGDGRKLYYRTLGKLMAVDIKTEPSFSVSKPASLFEDAFEVWTGEPGFSNYDIAPDGKRLLMSAPEARTEITRVHIVLDWFQELERLVPTKK